MNRDDVIRMAREASNNASGLYEEGEDLVMLYLDELERFAALVAAAEREACEQACWDAETNDWEGRKACIDAIRARGGK